MALGHRDSDKGRDGVIKEGETEFKKKKNILLDRKSVV